LKYTSAVPAKPAALHQPQFPTLLLWTTNNRNHLPNSHAGLLPPNKHQTNALKGAQRSCIKCRRECLITSRHTKGVEKAGMDVTNLFNGYEVFQWLWHLQAIYREVARVKEIFYPLQSQRYKTHLVTQKWSCFLQCVPYIYHCKYLFPY
jgi:hypothetical protein